MSTRTARAGLAPRYSPLFGVEIEIYIKVKPAFEAFTRERQRTAPDSLPDYWKAWNFDLENNTTETKARLAQRNEVSNAVEATIEHALGPDNGWMCDYDGTLQEKLFRKPENPRKWWGIEIKSPPMSVSKQWQLEIDMVFKALGKLFDFYTDHFCGCHVHISPGPTLEGSYTVDQLVKLANGAFFWESGLCDLLPQERRTNEFAQPNYAVFAAKEYREVPSTGWGLVFRAIEMASRGRSPKADFAETVSGSVRSTADLSTNFLPVDTIGTVELRRQAGAASAMTTTHRILLALTLYVSALRYDFDKVKERKTYTTGEELIKELAGCIKMLPETCHGSRFVAFLKWSLESYTDNKSFTNDEINEREAALRLGNPLPQQTSRDRTVDRTIPGASSQSAPAPRAPPAAGSTPQGRQGATPARGSSTRDTTTAPTARQGTTTSTRAPAGTGAGAGAGREPTTPGRQGGARAPTNTNPNSASQASPASPRPRGGRGAAAQGGGRGGAAAGGQGVSTSTSTSTSRTPAPQGGRGGGAAGTGRGGGATGGAGRGGATGGAGRGGGGGGGTSSGRGGGSTAPAAGGRGGGGGGGGGGAGATTRLPERPAGGGSNGTTAQAAGAAGRQGARRRQGESES